MGLVRARTRSSLTAIELIYADVSFHVLAISVTAIANAFCVTASKVGSLEAAASTFKRICR